MRLSQTLVQESTLKDTDLLPFWTMDYFFTCFAINSALKHKVNSKASALNS